MTSAQPNTASSLLFLLRFVDQAAQLDQRTDDSRNTGQHGRAVFDNRQDALERPVGFGRAVLQVNYSLCLGHACSKVRSDVIKLMITH